MGFREVNVVEVKEVLRAWLDGAGLRTVAERAGVDRKTARRYVQAAQAAGLERPAPFTAVTDDVVAAVVTAVRPGRPNGHGSAWEALEARHEQIQAWLGGGDGQAPLTVVKVTELLARSGCVVPYRTVHRYAEQRCGLRAASTTVRVLDGEPGVECQIDFARMGLMLDEESGRRRAVHALIFTAVLSRHMFVWLTYSQTLASVIAGCEAAWTFFGGVFKVLIPDNLKPVVTRADAVNPQLSTSSAGCPARSRGPRCPLRRPGMCGSPWTTGSAGWPPGTPWTTETSRRAGTPTATSSKSSPPCGPPTRAPTTAPGRPPGPPTGTRCSPTPAPGSKPGPPDDGWYRAIQTPSGGLHLHYPGTDQRNGSIRGQHLDFRATGGYVLLPPSLGQAKTYSRRYEVIRITDEPTRPLDWAAVTKLLIPAPAPRPYDPRTRSGRSGADPTTWLAATVAGQTEGNRNNALFWAACRAAEAGVTDYQPLLDAATSAGLPERQATRTIQSAHDTVTRGDGRPASARAPAVPRAVPDRSPTR